MTTPFFQRMQELLAQRLSAQSEREKLEAERAWAQFMAEADRGRRQPVRDWQRAAAKDEE